MKAPAKLVPGLPAYSIPSIIEGEFNMAASRASFIDGRLQETNRRLTSLAQSVGSSAEAVGSRCQGHSTLNSQ